MLLEVKRLTKRFGGLTAISEVDFQIEEGEIVSIIGPNGAGKTTFFNMISGLYPSDDGEIIFDGVSLMNITPEKVASYGIARTFQNIRLFPEMLTIENILVGMYLHTKYNFKDILFKTKKMKEVEKLCYQKAMDFLEYVGLNGKENELAKNLSYGDQRRLEIARALALEPKLLMLDEPAAGLNPKETLEMKEFIIDIREKYGCSILVIEHDMKLVMEISDKITVINYGIKIAEGEPREIRNNQEVIKAYLGQESQEITA